eukprot:815759_1
MTLQRIVIEQPPRLGHNVGKLPPNSQAIFVMVVCFLVGLGIGLFINTVFSLGQNYDPVSIPLRQKYDLVSISLSQKDGHVSTPLSQDDAIVSASLSRDDGDLFSLPPGTDNSLGRQNKERSEESSQNEDNYEENTEDG